MPRIAYKQKNFQTGTMSIIRAAITIIDGYQAQGFDLTLRQLYYQFVARGLIPNKDTEYNRLGSIINDARLAGYIDWDTIVDRTRNLRALAHWEDPSDIVSSAASSYRNELWKTQPEYVEVWIEKDALVGVIEGVCNQLDVPYFSCRGYTSQSEMWAAAQRLGQRVRAGKKVTILHLGDHDPSGIDMSRDIEERLFYFIAGDLTLERHGGHSPEVATEIARTHFFLERLALNMDQVEQYDPPPNPAKITDSRARGYIARHGDESWELDALEPTVMADLIRDAVADHVDADLMEAARQEQEETRAVLDQASERWEEVATFLRGA